MGTVFIDSPLWWLPVAAIALGIALFLYRRRNSARKWLTSFTPREPERTPVEDLQIRYLRGEIEQEEYEAERRELSAEF